MEPASQVHLVDGNGLLQGIPAIPLTNPGFVTPDKAVFCHHRGCGRAHLMVKPVGVGLGIGMTMAGVDLVFVHFPFPKTRDKEFPDAAAALLRRVHPPIPAVEGANDGHTDRIGCPETELYAAHPGLLQPMGAHAGPDVVVVALGKQVAVQFTHPLLTKPVGVVLTAVDAAPQQLQLVVTAGICR